MPTPLTSDNARPAEDARWQPRGVGLNPTFRCWGCDEPSAGIGSRRLGPLKLQHCAACVASIQAAKAAKEAACL